MLMDEHDEIRNRLRHLGAQPIEPRRQAADLVAMAGVRRSSGRMSGFLGSKVRLAAAFLVGLLLGGTGLAAADALPDPAQHVAHNVLARVGVDVPNPERYHGPECGAEVKRNHGAYVSDDPTLAQGRCGKPVHAGGSGGQGNGNGNGDGGADRGPCKGRPPWAGNTTMTDAEVEAAKAERAAQCGTDDAEADEVESDDVEADVPPEVVEEPTTTTAAPTTTTESTTTTSSTLR
jgi:hypothetical protein